MIGAQTRFEDNSNTPSNAANLNTLALGGNIHASSAGGLLVDVLAFRARSWQGTPADDIDYAGAVSQAVTDEATKYWYWIPSTNTLMANQASFPNYGSDQDFIPLATVTAAGGEVTAVVDKRIQMGY